MALQVKQAGDRRTQAKENHCRCLQYPRQRLERGTLHRRPLSPFPRILRGPLESVILVGVSGDKGRRAGIAACASQFLPLE